MILQRKLSTSSKLLVALILPVAMVASTFMAAAPAQAAGSCGRKTLHYGYRGSCAKYLQIMLNALAVHKGWAGNGYAGGQVIAADGVYGSNTRYQVIVAQRWFNSWHRDKVYVDGVAGIQTWGIVCSYAYHNNLHGYWARRSNHVASAHNICYWQS